MPSAAPTSALVIDSQAVSARSSRSIASRRPSSTRSTSASLTASTRASTPADVSSGSIVARGSAESRARARSRRSSVRQWRRARFEAIPNNQVRIVPRDGSNESTDSMAVSKVSAQQVLAQISSDTTSEEPEQVGGVLVVDQAPFDGRTPITMFHHATVLHRHKTLHIMYLPTTDPAVAKNPTNTDAARTSEGLTTDPAETKSCELDSAETARYSEVRLVHQSALYRHVPIDRFTRDRAVDVHQILALGRGCL